LLNKVLEFLWGQRIDLGERDTHRGTTPELVPAANVTRDQQRPAHAGAGVVLHRAVEPLGALDVRTARGTHRLPSGKSEAISQHIDDARDEEVRQLTDVSLESSAACPDGCRVVLDAPLRDGSLDVREPARLPIRFARFDVPVARSAALHQVLAEHGLVRVPEVRQGNGIAREALAAVFAL
jgi:hypothetical protein